MSYIKLFFVFIILAFIQFAVIPIFSIKGAFPNILLIYTVVLILNGRYKKSIFFAVLSGIFYDIFSLSVAGMYLFMFVLLTFILNFIINRFISNPILPFVILIFFFASIFIDLPAFFIGNRDMLLLLYVAISNTIFGTLLYYLLGEYLRPKKSMYKMKIK
jgi:rod shape-determining protein MreD